MCKRLRLSALQRGSTSGDEEEGLTKRRENGLGRQTWDHCVRKLSRSIHDELVVDGSRSDRRSRPSTLPVQLPVRSSAEIQFIRGQRRPDTLRRVSKRTFSWCTESSAPPGRGGVTK